MNSSNVRRYSVPTGHGPGIVTAVTGTDTGPSSSEAGVSYSYSELSRRSSSFSASNVSVFHCVHELVNLSIKCCLHKHSYRCIKCNANFCDDACLVAKGEDVGDAVPMLLQSSLSTPRRSRQSSFNREQGAGAVLPVAEMKRTQIRTPLKRFHGSQVFVSWTASPTEFYVGQVMDNAVFQLIEAAINQPESWFRGFADLTPGTLCCAFLDTETSNVDMSGWYRVKILDTPCTSSSSCINVQRIDYGSTHLCELKKLTPLPAFLHDVPGLAFRILSPSIRPAKPVVVMNGLLTSTWSNEAIKFFKSSVFGQICEFVPIEVNDEFNTGILRIGDMDLCDKMVQEGFAVYTTSCE